MMPKENTPGSEHTFGIDPVFEQDIPASHARAALRIADLLQRHGTNLDQDLSKALKIVSTTLGCDFALILEEAEAGHLISLAANTPIAVGVSWHDPASRLGQQHIVDDLASSDLNQDLPDPLTGLRSMLALPLASLAGTNRVVVVLSRDPGGFSASDMPLVRHAAGFMARAIQFDRLSRRNTMLAAIVGGHPNPQAGTDTTDSAFDSLGRAFDRLTRWQDQIAHLTDELLGTSSHTCDERINTSLRKLGLLAESDRTYVFRIRNGDRLDNTHEWVSPGILPMKDQLQDLSVETMGDWKSALESGHHVYIPDIDSLPDTSTTKSILKMQGIRSLLAVPMLRDGVLTGFVGHDSVLRRRTFLPAEIKLLQSAANSIGAVLDRVAAENEVSRANLHLEQERDRLQATLAALPDLVLEVDCDGRFTGFNAGSALPPAFGNNNLVGRLVEDVLPASLARIAHEMMAEVRKTGSAMPRDYSLTLEDGEHWYSAFVGTRREPGNKSGFVFVIRDVTESYINERKIRRLGRIAELTSNLVIVTDADRKIEWVNPAFEARTGWTLQDAVGKNPGKLLQFDGTDPETVARISTALRNGEPVRTEILNRSRSGEAYWISKDIQPLHDPQGELEGFVAVQTDITALKNSHQKALQLRIAAIEASIDGIAISDRSGQYIYMNAAHREMFGIDPNAEIQTIRWTDITPADVAASFIEQEWPRMEADRRWRGKLKGIHRDCSILDLDVSLALTPSGEMICIARDITERERTERERIRLGEDLQIALRRETIAHIASGVAHDLNNLVAVVSGTVSLIQDSHELPIDVQGGLRRIARATDAARDLVNGLGDLDRPNSVKGPHDLRKLVVEAIDLLGSERSRRFGIHANLPADPQIVWANRTEFLQVLVNLALNACDAGEEGRNKVSLSVLDSETTPPARPPDAGAFDPERSFRLFRIEDSGLGIDASIRDRLFERYITTKGSRGTGLGLPIVASILRDNRGALWIETVENRGTIVTVAWPTEQPGQSAKRVVEGSPNQLDTLDGLKVLIVDDNLDFADLLSDILEAEGAICVSLSDPLEAREVLSGDMSEWSLLITDLDMPGLDGIGLAKCAAQLQPPVPTILVTALATREAIDCPLFRDVLRKPIDPSVLLEHVRKSLRN